MRSAKEISIIKGLMTKAGTIIKLKKWNTNHIAGYNHESTQNKLIDIMNQISDLQKMC